MTERMRGQPYRYHSKKVDMVVETKLHSQSSFLSGILRGTAIIYLNLFWAFVLPISCFENTAGSCIFEVAASRSIVCGLASNVRKKGE